MSRLDSTTEVFQIARGLDLAVEKRSVKGIKERVLVEIGEAVDTAPIPVDTIKALERVLCSAWRVRVERIYDDEDLERIATRWVRICPNLADLLQESFSNGNALGRLFCNGFPDDGRTIRFLIVADARGDKASQAEFTVWHELAHVATRFFPGEHGDIVTSGTEPTSAGETLMDVLAAEMMFYDPLWRPTWLKEVDTWSTLSFELIESVRTRYCPEASFFATAIRCTKHFAGYCRLVRIAPGLKVSEVDEIAQRKLQVSIFKPDSQWRSPLPVPKLRVVDCIWPISRDGRDPLDIWPNMRAPEDSVLTKIFNERLVGHYIVAEDQAMWDTSSGGELDSLPLRVEAKVFGPNLLALLQPADS